MNACEARKSRLGSAADKGSRLFPRELPAVEWTTFEADGFSRPVAGLIFDAQHPACCGVALGGLGTGCLDIETSGVLGHSCIFNPPDTPRGRSPQLMLPFLGISVDSRVWVLSTQRFIDGGTISCCSDPLRDSLRVLPPEPLQDPLAHPRSPEHWGLWQANVPRADGVRPANGIRYWGHYPVADIEYDIDAPISVGLRAWSPFIPGDAADSSIPGAVFEVRLRNSSSVTRKGTLAFSFPGPNSVTTEPGGAAGYAGIVRTYRYGAPNFHNYGKFRRSVVEGDGMRGVALTSVGKKKTNYVLAAIGNENVRSGRGLTSDPTAWSGIADQLPFESIKDSTAAEDSSVSLAVGFEIRPHETKTVRFVLAWYSPHWTGMAYDYIEPVFHMGAKRWSPDPKGTPRKRARYTAAYAARYGSALDVAKRLARDHESLLERVLAWQEAIYTDDRLPIWLRDCLVNNLNLIAEDSYWAQPAPPLGDWAAPLGAFGLDESPRSCPLMGCMASNWYGDLPITYFFPELDRMLLRNYMEYMRPDGAVPFLYPPGDWTNPTYEWLISLNGPCFADLVNRLWRRTGDDAVLTEFYPAVKRNVVFTMNLKSGPYGVVSAHREGTGQEWWEHTPVQGMVAHLGGMHLAQLLIAEGMAKKMGDAGFADRCRAWFTQGSRLLEEHLWAEDYYLFFRDVEKGKESDLIMSSQLDGDWSAFLNGLAGVFPAERARKALETIRRTCLVDCGLVGFADQKTGPLLVEYGTFPPEISIVGMTYLYRGERELGLEIVRRNMDNLVRKHRHPWDLPNLIRGDTGERTFGTDYFQNMVLWAVPAALEGDDLTAPCEDGGLVDRVLEAGRPRCEILKVFHGSLDIDRYLP